MSHDLRHVARTFAAKSTTCLTKRIKDKRNYVRILHHAMDNR